MKARLELILLGFVFLVFILQSGLAVQPNGATISIGTSSGPDSGNASNLSSQAGNTTHLEIFTGNAGTQAWQAYFGSVTGGLSLADANGGMIYNWSLTTPSGEIYSSTNSTINWENIQCFNFTAKGNFSTGGEVSGNTSLYGMNLTQLESQYGISSGDLDSVNVTFENFNHDLFYTANYEFTADECRSVQLFTNESASEDGVFEEILLYEPTTASVVFASLLENDVNGFNGSAVDFEMVVLEDGHGDDTDTTPYFFFVEVE